MKLLQKNPLAKLAVNYVILASPELLLAKLIKDSF